MCGLKNIWKKRLGNYCYVNNELDAFKYLRI